MQHLEVYGGSSLPTVRSPILSDNTSAKPSSWRRGRSYLYERLGRSQDQRRDGGATIPFCQSWEEPTISLLFSSFLTVFPP
jgi:hypothetical protein